ncbi:heavy metal translocating P-type ATPase metal-binding domain-containing protein [Brevifollis gellanilyticus]|uniref:Copper-translocating P-type ATPase n=1 Tax=Brevifollis gellanilyticus TaxID=748831 RepID=A0A512M9G8_9BACT|nr:heavy metal translocating P-type ATPase metal-binding domain-containing protein [Brevifollis gellanilyticus]GEP43372.1 copper-translocating P-type ATPase [Brevifollis gellanilyticus]
MSALCQHCGTPVPATRSDGFCCSGCLHVHHMLHEHGLEHFYHLKAGQAVPPVSAQALREQDYEWLEAASKTAEAVRVNDSTAVELSVSIQGLSCMACIWLIERVFAKMGGTQIHVDMTRGELRFGWEPGKFSPVEFAQELQRFGYLLGAPRTDAGGAADNDLERRTGLCGAFAMNAMAFSLPAYFGMPADFAFARSFDLVAAASATLALLVGGSYFAMRAWRALQAGVLHIDTPITLGILAAYAGSIIGWLCGEGGLKYFDFVAMFIFLMLGGRLVQQMAVARNRRRLLRDPSIPEESLLRELRAGAEFTVKAGQAVPVAAKLEDAHASISLEWINGESDTCTRSAGQLLPSGALNAGTQALHAIALETWRESTLCTLLEARRGGDSRDLRLERLLRGYLIVVVLAGVIGGLWWWLSTDDWTRAVQVMISVFVVSCPCALGVAMPLADDIAASRAERHGVFVRSLGLWKKLTQLSQVVFDKTGTLTLENPVLVNADALDKLDACAQQALRHLTSGNLHPVSRSLFDALAHVPDASHEAEVLEEAGHGLSFQDADGRMWALSRPVDASADAVFTRDGAVIAAYRFRDALRAESRDEMAALRERGLQVRILSGDREAKVAATAAQLMLRRDEWQHSLTPGDKAAWITAHDAPHTVYIGDGANDSLAFDAALCAGSPVSGRSFLEHKADFYFLGHSMRFMSRLLGIADTHRLAVRLVFAFSVTYNVVTAITALMGHLSPLLAAILMPLSSAATLSLVALIFRSRTARESSDGMEAVTVQTNLAA